MITVIITLSLLAIKDEIVGIIELFATLQGNTFAYRIITFISIITGLFEIRFVSVYEGSWFNYTIIVVIVGIVGAEVGAQILKFKTRIKNWLKRKRISKGMKKKWEERKIEQQANAVVNANPGSMVSVDDPQKVANKVNEIKEEENEQLHDTTSS